MRGSWHVAWYADRDDGITRVSRAFVDRSFVGFEREGGDVRDIDVSRRNARVPHFGDEKFEEEYGRFGE